MYTLTLSLAERRAIDWIGHRYRHGDDLRRALWHSVQSEGEWDDKGDITFIVPENIAWEICQIIEDDDLACFSAELVNKLHQFRERVV